MSSVAVRPDVTRTVEQVMSGDLFSGLLLDGSDQRALALEALLGKVVDDDTRVVWIGNPLRSPLTIERFLIQIVGPEIDLRIERGPAELAQIIAKPIGHESRLLIIVQQPETIDAETLHLLVQMGWYLGGEPVHVQFLFAGSSAFVVPRCAKPQMMAFPQSLSRPDEELVTSAPRRRDILPLVLLLLTTTIGVLISMAPASPDGTARPDIADGLPTQAGRPPRTSPDVPLLRREFDMFLAQRDPPLPPMTDRARDALFNDVLTHHRRE